MSASESYAELLLTHMRAEHAFAVVGLLWPLALTGYIALLRWKRLQSKLGFLILGVLACFGLQAFLARLTRYVFWTYLAPMQPRYYLTALRAMDPIVITAASAILSVPLLLWFAALLRVPLTSNDRSRGP
jgi:hypothetical protein